ncbi:coniferyl aldehyde dehydrogenase [Pseudorhodoferax sp.]|uniref:coniferyl aldehyde dehydrogenase n=1 Tax=Pseudorhodoferax sp. TaxID=1993553 RepID=UPI002DD6AFA3|nr:coniferyl aldehyde dehydrogenase [Pseudorhodoferax sp.]
MTALAHTETPEIEHALRAAFDGLRAGFEAERDPGLAVRLDRLRRLETMVTAMAPAMAAAISADFGHRPAQVTQLADLTPVLLGLRHARRHLRGWMKTRRMPTSLIYRPGHNRLMRQPLGVVGIVSPWNFPGLLALGPALAALAAGNRVMIKPSEIGPRFSELLREQVGAHFGADEMVVVTGDADLGRAFVALPFDHLLFTGSTAVGRQVALAAAANLTPVTLELGGKSPAIIGAGADLERTALRLVAGKLLNAGQTCIAPDYVAVPRGQVQAFVDALRRAHRQLYPTVATNPDYTAIATERHYRRLLALLDEARAQGAEVLSLHDEGPSDAARKLPLHVVLRPMAAMRVMQEELFGPILPVLAYDDVDETIRHINAGDRPLALYWFGSDDAEREKVLRQTLAGGVTVNDTLWHIGQEALPFGGVGASGMGAYHGEWGFRTFSKETGVFHQHPLAGTRLLYPPYGRVFQRLSALIRRIG